MKRIKVPRLFSTKKLSAATARRASAASTGMDFEGIPEPNMKLSRALLIVLLLHVVAVSGIIAFNAIKTRERAFVPSPAAEAADKSGDGAKTTNHLSTEQPRPAAPQRENDQEHQARPAASPGREQQTKTPASSGKTYVVKKGDNPAGIAKKLKVSYNDLMAINHIDDPHKLRIGQKLMIPEAAKPKTRSSQTTSKKKPNEVHAEKNDAKAHRTPKALRTKSTNARAWFRAPLRYAHACSPRLHDLVSHAS